MTILKEEKKIHMINYFTFHGRLDLNYDAIMQGKALKSFKCLKINLMV